jgi:hypothetical protein
MSLQHLMPYLDTLWLAGVLFLSLRALGGWWLIRRLRRAHFNSAPRTRCCSGSTFSAGR